jgi:hypothetical protein
MRLLSFRVSRHIHCVSTPASGEGVVRSMEAAMKFLQLLILAVTGGLLYAAPFSAQSGTPPPAPKLVHFSTYLGGSARDALRSLAVDAVGRLHVAGWSCSADAPTTADAISRTPAGSCDGYLAILSPEGALLYGTYIGGSASNDAIDGLALDGAGNIYLVGHTGSTDFPTTAGAYDRTCGHDGACTSLRWGGRARYADAFVMKLTPMGGAIVYSTYLGGGDTDMARAVAVDAAGRVHVAGVTDSANFPWTPGAPGQGYTDDMQNSNALDGFYSRLSTDGSTLLYSTYINGSRGETVTGLALDGAGAAYIGGYTMSPDFLVVRAMQPASGGFQDGWLMKIAAGGTLEFSTYLGGNSFDTVDDVFASGGFVYLTGHTSSGNFPKPRIYDDGSYIVKMTDDGTTFTRVVMVPSRPVDVGLTVDQHDRAYFMGRTTSYWTTTTTSDAAQPQNAGHDDVVFAMFDMAEGQPDAPLYATFFGASVWDIAADIAIDTAGSVYLTGLTTSGDFPLINPADGVYAADFSEEGFVTRFSVGGIPRRDAAGEVVLYASDADNLAGRWSFVRDVSAAGGVRLFNPDAGAAKLTAPLAQPGDHVDFTFTANAGVPYRLWIRGKAQNDQWSNDSVYVQFSDGIDASGQPMWRIGTTSGTSVNLEDCVHCGVERWGWQDNGYGAGVLGPTVRFAATGAHTVRVQVREDGFSFDQIVLSSARFLNGAPGALKKDGVVLGRSNSGDTPPSDDDPPPPACDAREIVIHPGVSATVAGAWIGETDASAASGRRVRHPDAGAAKLTAPLASPANYFEVTFRADANVAYRVWMRGRAQNNHWANDSVFAQFDGSLDESGHPVWRIGTTSGTTINLEDGANAGLAGWGWQDNGYGAGVLGPTVRFATTGTQRLRVQTREDGFAIDQIVLSASRYASGAPGPLKNDSTILRACSGEPAPPAPTNDPGEVVLYPARD